MTITRDKALENPAAHVLMRGAGYQYVGPPASPPLRVGQAPVVPSAIARDGSAHMLKPPNGAKPMRFIWDAVHQVWYRHGGNRLAFSATFLGAHGWKYGKATK